jgi:hypothetical protein
LDIRKSKFRVSSSEQSEEVQKWLFTQGCAWFLDTQDCRPNTVRHINGEFLYVCDEKYITYGGCEDQFYKKPYKELSLVITYTPHYTIVETETVKVLGKVVNKKFLEQFLSQF